MPSVSYRRWRSVRAAALDRIEAAHAAIGGTGPGRRYATQQINHAYLVLLAAEFQGFCRALHDDCIVAVISALQPPLQPLIERSLRLNRQLDRGNATPAALGSDFGRIIINFWPKLVESDPRVQIWQASLTQLNEWRNAIVHSDFAHLPAAGTMTLRLKQVRRLRNACRQLARTFDDLLRIELNQLIGRQPW